MSKVTVLIVAGGTGLRLGTDTPKQFLKVDNKTIIEHTIAKFSNHQLIDNICVVIAKEHEKQFAALFSDKIKYCFGGKERKDSVRLGLEYLEKNIETDYVLIHDAARPFIEEKTITNVINQLKDYSAVLAACKVRDTIKKYTSESLQTITPRESLYTAQTPQGFNFKEILSLHKKYKDFEVTDDCMIFEKEGLHIKIVDSPSSNFKITDNADLELAKLRISKMTKLKVGSGFDVHKFKKESQETFVTLCGVKVPSPYSIIAHSDGDVALHALTDALLGTVGAGDIGYYFPPSDDQWKNADSKIFVQHALELIKQKGGVINNIDLTIMGEKPKINPHRDKLAQSLATICGIALEDVNIKATTTEKLGYLGREEGMACQAVVLAEFK